MDVFETTTMIPRRKSGRKERVTSGLPKAFSGFLVFVGICLFLGGIGTMYGKYDDETCFSFLDCLDVLSIILFALGLFFIGFGSYYLEKDRRLRRELEKEDQ